MNSDQTPTRNQKPNVSFEPLHSGLGFHPFSDGLPYSVPNKNRMSTSARPSPQLSKPTPQTLQQPLADRMNSRPENPRRQENFRPPMEGPWVPPVLPQGTRPTWKTASNTSAPLPKKIISESPGASYLIARVFSYGIDCLVHTSLVGGIIWLTLWFNEMDLRILTYSGMLPVIAVFLIAFNWFLVTLQELIFHTSLGKSLFQLVIPASRGKILFRSLIFIPSALSGIGLIFGIFNRKRSCLHDLPFETQPIRVTKL